MRWPVFVLLFLLGCQSSQLIDIPDTRNPLFTPSSMRIHPIFTQVSDFTGDGRADGIEALVEFQDQFGDPTKASGKILFELCEFRRGFADPRGRRVVNPWVASLTTLDDQLAHWNRTSRTYGFKLAYPGIERQHAYVLTATFERETGKRFFDRIVITPSPPPPSSAASNPVPPLRESSHEPAVHAPKH